MAVCWVRKGVNMTPAALPFLSTETKKESSWVRMVCAQQFKGVFSSNLGSHCAPVQLEVTRLFHCASQRRRYEALTHYKIKICGKWVECFSYSSRNISKDCSLWKSRNLFVNLVFIFKQESAVIENRALTQF